MPVGESAKRLKIMMHAVSSNVLLLCHLSSCMQLLPVSWVQEAFLCSVIVEAVPKPVILVRNYLPFSTLFMVNEYPAVVPAILSRVP